MIQDSLVKAEQLHIDSVYAAKKAKEDNYLDSFKNSPIGKAELKAQILANKKKQSILKADQLLADKRAKKAKKVMDKFSCTEDEAIDVLDGKIWIGMTYEMLVYQLGRPYHLNPSNYGSGNQYQACWEGLHPSCFYFKEDHIIYAYN